MRIQFIAPLFALLAAATASAFAQDPNILDDFTTGHYQSPGYYYGPTHDSVQYGKMIGGSRDTNMNVCPTNAKCPTYNPYNQPSSYGFFPATATEPAAMVQTAGFYAAPRIDMAYGFHGVMHENFGAYDKIRVNFKGLSQTLNFNIQLFTGTSWAQGGCNIPTYPAEFAIELPLDKFVTTKGFTFSDVTYMNLIFQDGSAIGGVGFAITSVELTNTTKPGNTISCHY
jgi:hypothetical protein